MVGVEIRDTSERMKEAMLSLRILGDTDDVPPLLDSGECRVMAKEGGMKDRGKQPSGEGATPNNMHIRKLCVC